MKKVISITMLAMLAISVIGFIPNTGADTQFQTLWVRMRGWITQWGSTPVFGWIDAHARIVNDNGTYHEWAGVHAIWSTNQDRLNCTHPPTENFTFSFYAARLAETEMMKFNYSGYDFYIKGKWNVVNITTAIYFDENGRFIEAVRDVEPVVTNATGELRVFTIVHEQFTEHLFELSIEGVDLLSGMVRMYFIGYMEIKLCDTNGDGKVDLMDLVKVAKKYHKVPGLNDYELEMDFNFNYEIDIGDLTTVAANIEP